MMTEQMVRGLLEELKSYGSEEEKIEKAVLKIKAALQEAESREQKVQKMVKHLTSLLWEVWREGNLQAPLSGDLEAELRKHPW